MESNYIPEYVFSKISVYNKPEIIGELYPSGVVAIKLVKGKSVSCGSI
jgi:hypothetical protein